MKIRRDFVTNSSSSSFIVYCNDDLKINITNEDIFKCNCENLDYVDADNINWDKMKNKALKITNSDELFEFIKNEFFYLVNSDLEMFVDDEYKKIFEKYLSKLKLYSSAFYFNRINDCDKLYDQLTDLESCIESEYFYKNKIKIESFNH